MNGQLSEHPLVELLREIQTEKLSGVLRLLRERVKGIIYLDAGRALFATTNLRAHRLLEAARRCGLVNESKLRDAHSHAVKPFEQMSDDEMRAFLISNQIINEDELTALQTEQATDALRAMLLWTDGEWHFARLANAFEAMSNLPQICVELPPLLVEAARRLPPEFIAARLSDDEMLHPLVSFSDALPHDLSPSEGFILSRLEQPTLVSEVVLLSGLQDAQARQIIYALALADAIKRDGWQRKLADAPLTSLRASPQISPPKAAVNLRASSRAPQTANAISTTNGAHNGASSKSKANSVSNAKSELTELFRRAEANNHYDVLGVTRDAANAEVKSAYHALAKRFHPDRFRRETDDIRARVERAFARIAQAYDALKDETGRAAYNLKLKAQEKRAAEAANISAKAGNNLSNDMPSVAHLPPERQAAARFKHGMDALKNGNSPLAAMMFAEAVRLQPNNARYHAMYGNALACDKRTHRQAEAELQKAVALDGKEISYRMMLAEFYKQIGLRLRAVNELERALQIDSGHVGARRLLDEMKQAK
jgi:curved DNA-binding protein CbpA